MLQRQCLLSSPCLVLPISDQRAAGKIPAAVLEILPFAERRVRWPSCLPDERMGRSSGEYRLGPGAGEVSSRIAGAAIIMGLFAKLLSTLLFGVAANADNLTLGFAYGLKGRRIGWLANLLIAIITTAITLVTLIFGRAILPCCRLGCPLLSAAACWWRWRPGACTATATGSSSIPQWPALTAGAVSSSRRRSILSGVLSINNIGLAVASGIGGIDPAPAAISIFFFSVVLLVLGQALSAKLAQVRNIGRLLHSPLGGDVVVLLAGMAMLVGY